MEAYKKCMLAALICGVLGTLCLCLIERPQTCSTPMPEDLVVKKEDLPALILGMGLLGAGIILAVQSQRLSGKGDVLTIE